VACPGPDPPVADHLIVLPSKALALAASHQLGTDSTSTALQLVLAACKALQAAARASSNPGNLNTAGSNLVNGGKADDQDQMSQAGTYRWAAHCTSSSMRRLAEADAALLFKLLLESAALLQRCNQQAVPAVIMEQLAEAAKGCSKQQLQQLVVLRGQLLLHVLSEYLQQPPVNDAKQQLLSLRKPTAVQAQIQLEQQHQHQPGQGNAADSSGDVSGLSVTVRDSVSIEEGEELSEEDVENDERCVCCAQVCPEWHEWCMLWMRHADGPAAGNE
jgi:hypothetical protein